jgi:hypothetical protein
MLKPAREGAGRAIEPPGVAVFLLVALFCLALRAGQHIVIIYQDKKVISLSVLVLFNN